MDAGVAYTGEYRRAF